MSNNILSQIIHTGYPETTNATEQQTLLKSISSHRESIPVWEQLVTDQFDPWQVVPRQVSTLCSRQLISTAFVVVSRIGCLGVTDVLPVMRYYQSRRILSWAIYIKNMLPWHLYFVKIGHHFLQDS